MVNGWMFPDSSDYNIYWNANVLGEQHPVDLVDEEADVTVTVE